MSARATMLAGLVGLATLIPTTAFADLGHIGLTAGAMTIEESNQTEVRPRVRTELAFRLWGPFELGGYMQVAALGLDAEMASFGGGVFLQVRPDIDFWGFVPHLEVAGSRVTLPISGDRVDSWSLSAGAGLGYEVGAGFILEARVHHQWYFDLPAEGPVGVDGWTFSAGFAYRLPD